MLNQLKRRVQALKFETLALYYATRHPATPRLAKLLIALVVAYALSPIDLIPDFIPVLGYLDDLVLLPLGIALAIRLVPRSVLDDCRRTAQEKMADGKPSNHTAAAVIVAIWITVAVLISVWAYRVFAGA